MDAVVLAGGYATRLWPITRHRPKMFLPLGDRTVIDTILDDLEADDRITDVYLSTNERFAPEFRAYLENSRYEKPALSVEQTTEEDEKLGVIGALAQLVDREGIDDDLLVVAGDNLVSFDLSEFVDEFERRHEPTLAAYDVGSTDRAKSFGLVDLDGDRVVDFQEKPDDPKSTLVSIACYCFPADAVRFDEYLRGGNNPDEPGWFVQWLQARDSVYAYTFDGAWFDIGSAEGYLDAIDWLLDGGNRVAPEATVTDTSLHNALVLPGATVRNSALEDTVVFPETTVTDATLERTVVDEHATVDGVTLSDSVIGPYAALGGDNGATDNHAD